MIIDQSTDIQNLLQFAYENQIEFIIYLTTDLNQYVSNTMGKLSNINIIHKKLIFNIQNLPLKNEKNYILKEKISKCFFLIKSFRYQFESQLEFINLQSPPQLIISLPSRIEYRQNRRHVRIPNALNQIELDNHTPQLIDISVSGSAIIVPNISNIKTIQQIELNIPFLLEDLSNYQSVIIDVKTVREEAYNDHYRLLGLEFQNISVFNQDIIYQYIIARKNELLFHLNELLPVTVGKIV